MDKLRLSDITTVVSGQAAPKDKYFGNDGFPFIRAGNLESLINGFSEFDLPKVNRINSKKLKLKLIPPNTILFAKSGMSATKNRVYKTNNPSYIVSHLAGVLPSEKYCQDYLAWYLKWYGPSKMILDDSYPSIRLADIEKLEIPLPPLATQKKIAAILEKADELRQNDKKILEKYDRLAQSVFLEMFGDPVRNEKGWKQVSFREIVAVDCPLTYGIVQPGDEFPGGIPIVRPVDLIEKFVTLKGLKRINPIISSLFKRTILKGDELLLSVRGSVGTVSIATAGLKGANVTRGIVPIWARPYVSNMDFIYGLFTNERFSKNLKDLSKGATLIQLNLEDLRDLVTILPPLELQGKYSNIIKGIDLQKQFTGQSLQKSEELFQSLLQRAFRGELW